MRNTTQNTLLKRYQAVWNDIPIFQSVKTLLTLCPDDANQF